MSRSTQLLAAGELDLSLEWLRDLFEERCASGDITDQIFISDIFEAKVGQPMRRASAELEESCR